MCGRTQEPALPEAYGHCRQGKYSFFVRQSWKARCACAHCLPGLESCYLADLAAVENGLELSGIAKHQGKQKYRSPDYLGSPSSELARLTKERYQKVGGSRAIGPWLDPENVRSDSFRNLVTGIRQIGAEAAP